jgi:hypothetical protein
MLYDDLPLGLLPPLIPVFEPDAIHAFFAHSMGLHASQVTMFRLLIGFVYLGFSIGFVLHMQKPRED